MSADIDVYLDTRDEVIKQRKELEQTIQRDITAALDSFRFKYGWTPTRLEIRMIECTTIGDRVEQSMVGEVTAYWRFLDE